MALTINTHPNEVITNAPEFNVTTSLSESGNQQDLRVRATIYIGGETAAVATLEQRKGLNNWDFFDILKSLTGKCNEAVGGSDMHIGPTKGSQLITGWTNRGSSWDIAFATSGREISDARSNAGAQALSNDLGSEVVGDVFVVGYENDYLDQGGNKVYLVLTNTGYSGNEAEIRYAGLSSGEMKPNHVYFMMGQDTESAPVLALVADNNADVAGTFFCYKISDYKNNPGVYFHVKFEEIYENSSDVTKMGDTDWADTLLFIPATMRPGEDFETDFLVTAASKAPLSRAAGCLYKFGIGQEMRILYACVSAYDKITIVTDAGSSDETDIPNMGWGMIIINDNIASVDAEDASIGISMASVSLAGAPIYTGFSLTILTELESYHNSKVLSFVGALGEETAMFRGLLSEIGNTNKSFYSDANSKRKVLKSYKGFQMLLRTIYETEEYRRLLHELTYTEKQVWLFDSDLTTNYREVTVITDEVTIEDQKELIESEIEIEYYE